MQQEGESSSLSTIPDGGGGGDDGDAGEASFPVKSVQESSFGLDDNDLEDLEDPFGGNSYEGCSDAHELNNENELRRKKFHAAGYRDGIIAGKEAIAQEGYNFGYKESVLAGYNFGIVRGVSSALAFLPDDLREKLIDEQETKEKFQKLHSDVHALSTEVAMKRFYQTLTTKQGEEKRVKDASDSESGPGEVIAQMSHTRPLEVPSLESYVNELSSLLDKTPKIEVKLGT